jgi:hypothetical protein
MTNEELTKYLYSPVGIEPQLPSEDPFVAWGQTSDPYLQHLQDSLKDYISENYPDTVGPAGSPLLSYPVPSSNLGLPSASASAPLALEAGPSGYASLDALAGTTLPYAGEESMAADTATSGSSAWGGPATYAGNMALNMIPTRDRNKINTPLGDEGSMSGILKGTGKGALTAATISGGNPYATVAGAVLGAYGGAQGYFDSTTPPQIQIGRIKRGGGRMPQGLLGGGIYA